MFASAEGHTEVVKVLLEYEAETDAAMKNGALAWMLAEDKGLCEIVRFYQMELRIERSNRTGSGTPAKADAPDPFCVR
jgi:hypothetical protein